MHIRHCVQCHSCLPHYSWGSRHCTFGIVHNAICDSPTTVHIWHCGECGNWVVIPQCQMCNFIIPIAQLALWRVREMGCNTTMPNVQSHYPSAHLALWGVREMGCNTTMPIVRLQYSSCTIGIGECAGTGLLYHNAFCAFSLPQLHIWHCGECGNGL